MEAADVPSKRRGLRGRSDIQPGILRARRIPPLKVFKHVLAQPHDSSATTDYAYLEISVHKLGRARALRKGHDGYDQ